jgi:phosphoglycerate dehydrogenase-like enzyme
VIVCEVPGSNANIVAEHTLALMLALSRRIIAVIIRHNVFAIPNRRAFRAPRRRLRSRLRL